MPDDNGPDDAAPTFLQKDKVSVDDFDEKRVAQMAGVVLPYYVVAAWWHWMNQVSTLLNLNIKTQNPQGDHYYLTVPDGWPGPGEENVPPPPKFPPG